MPQWLQHHSASPDIILFRLCRISSCIETSPRLCLLPGMLFPAYTFSCSLVYKPHYSSRLWLKHQAMKEASQVLHLNLMPFLYSFIHSPIHSYLLKACCTPALFQALGMQGLDQLDSSRCSNGAYILVGEKDKAQMSKTHRIAHLTQLHFLPL